jgi:hypothetical protein
MPQKGERKRLKVGVKQLGIAHTSAAKEKKRLDELKQQGRGSKP